MKNTIQKRQPKSPSIDLYQTVTDKLISLLEQGVAPWHRPWNGYGLPRNIATNHIYSGINTLLLSLTPHPIPYFMSFKQAKSKGGKIRKGAESERVFFYKSYYKNADGKSISQEDYTTLQQQGADPQRIAFLKYYRVFNIADIEGVEIDLPNINAKTHQPIEECERLFKHYTHAPTLTDEDPNQAWYQPSQDRLNMPNMSLFHTVEAYYCTLFHELTHSTGHASRLNREGISKVKPFGSPDYSKEELIAECGASFLCAKMGIANQPIVENNAAYLQGWLTILKADPKLIFKAAAAAQKAVDFILTNSSC